MEDVVEMIRYLSQAVGETAVGDFISEPGKNDLEADLIRSCRWRIIASLDFRDLPFDAALRKLLTKSGFRLPGEAQKIERVAQTFAQVYSAQNPHPQRREERRQAVGSADRKEQ